MGLKITAQKVVRRSVTVHEPGEGDRVLTHTIGIDYRVLGRDEANELIARGENEFLRAIICGWDERVQDGDGNPLPFNEHNRDLLIQVPYVYTAVTAAYFRSVLPEERARKGN